MFKNNGLLEFSLQKSNNLDEWENVPVELMPNKPRLTIELPLNGSAQFYRLIALNP